MKDLDFDELDKAVNSLMAGKKDETPAPADSPAPAAPPPSTASSTPVVVSTTRSASTSPASLGTSPRPVAPAARRGGRFMDVVPAAKKEPAAPVSRQGVTLQPTDASLTEASASKQPDDDKKAEHTPASKVPSSAPAVPSATTQAPASDWPDPLELAMNSAKSESEAVKEEPSISKPNELTPSVDVSTSGSLGKDEVSTTTSSSEEPLSSPFLPDAKVEKRPLGSAALGSAGSELMAEDENSQLPALPKDVEPTLPEELHGDVVSLEADNSTTDPVKHLKETEKPKLDELATQDKEDLKSTTPDEPKKPAVTVTEAAVPTGPTSIPQQYKEEQSTGDEKNGAIYDTDSYHQPLSHPVKKKSGWSWVIWIILILLVGAAAGAALFLLGIVG